MPPERAIIRHMVAEVSRCRPQTAVRSPGAARWCAAVRVRIGGWDGVPSVRTSASSPSFFSCWHGVPPPSARYRRRSAPGGRGTAAFGGRCGGRSRSDPAGRRIPVGAGLEDLLAGARRLRLPAAFRLGGVPEPRRRGGGMAGTRAVQPVRDRLHRLCGRGRPARRHGARAARRTARPEAGPRFPGLLRRLRAPAGAVGDAPARGPGGALRRGVRDRPLARTRSGPAGPRTRDPARHAGRHG